MLTMRPGMPVAWWAAGAGVGWSPAGGAAAGGAAGAGAAALTGVGALRLAALADTGGGPACLSGGMADLGAVTVTLGPGAPAAGWGVGFTSVVAIPRTLFALMLIFYTIDVELLKFDAIY